MKRQSCFRRREAPWVKPGWGPSSLVGTGESSQDGVRGVRGPDGHAGELLIKFELGCGNLGLPATGHGEGPAFPECTECHLCLGPPH